MLAEYHTRAGQHCRELGPMNKAHTQVLLREMLGTLNPVVEKVQLPFQGDATPTAPGARASASSLERASVRDGGA